MFTVVIAILIHCKSILWQYTCHPEIDREVAILSFVSHHSICLIFIIPVIQAP